MDFTTITNQEKAEILQLLEEIKDGSGCNLYVKNRAKTITKIINKNA